MEQLSGTWDEYLQIISSVKNTKPKYLSTSSSSDLNTTVLLPLYLCRWRFFITGSIKGFAPYTGSGSGSGSGSGEPELDSGLGLGFGTSPEIGYQSPVSLRQEVRSFMAMVLEKGQNACAAQLFLSSSSSSLFSGRGGEEEQGMNTENGLSPLLGEDIDCIRVDFLFTVLCAMEWEQGYAERVVALIQVT